MSTSIFNSDYSKTGEMASSSNSSGGLQYITIPKKHQELLSKMLLIDLAELNRQNTTTVVDKIKNIITILVQLSASEFEVLIQQLKQQIMTKAETIAQSMGSISNFDCRSRETNMHKGTDGNLIWTNYRKSQNLERKSTKLYTWRPTGTNPTVGTTIQQHTCRYEEFEIVVTQCTETAGNIGRREQDVSFASQQSVSTGRNIRWWQWWRQGSQRQ
jgi:hypothetical protein